MTNASPKIIGYGVIAEVTGPVSGPYLLCEEMCDTLEQAIQFAEEGLDRDIYNRVRAVFSIDSHDNVVTIYTGKAFQRLLDDKEEQKREDAKFFPNNDYRVLGNIGC